MKKRKFIILVILFSILLSFLWPLLFKQTLRIVFGSAAVDKQTTMAQLHNVATACGVYKKVHGAWPRDLDKLGEVRAGQHITDISGKSRDVWGNPILYECPSFSSNSVGSVTSYGPDGAPGGDDDLVLFFDWRNQGGIYITVGQQNSKASTALKAAGSAP